MRKSKRPFILVVVPALAVFMAIALTEVFLRLNGERPGMLNNLFEPYEKDAVAIDRCYEVDSFGIMKFSAYARNCINASVEESLEQKRYVNKPCVSEIYQAELIAAYLPFEHNSYFFSWVDSLKKQPLDNYAQVLLDYTLHPINEEGFRSIPFKNNGSGKKKILLIGDSFTYGYSAYPFVESFYDKLLMSGKYEVYNAGITSTDPVQYLQVMRKYVPLLQPDYVVVNFFWGNDLMLFPREPKPYQFQMYPVRGQMIAADPFGEYLSLDEAWEVALYSNILPNQDISFFNRLMAKSVLGTYLWKTLSRMNLVAPTDHRLKKYMKPSVKNNHAVNTQPVAKQIAETMQTNTGTLLMCLFPDPYITNPYNTIYTPRQVFDTLPYQMITGNRNYYNPAPDGHLNNAGHTMFAEYLTHLIDSLEGK